ncbi:Uncharacterized protein T310_5472 [Rasamsonia emersonii CBS 393.64]|uniref:GST C-terminal domain-containing protein n=1 Tax=Rasamsonia emersonii (strain ATCC 16479 / CBS 393.64 / IMI 116815) TaxID=1408163 RepID=A0A0F4YQF3_RASE3|nr:Uncharacterized protein T310_5472 [Rasamsonia emersonii CBS 393.64]KKA20484.1 Uncharacterized protein T310_5472 [Rasamsonia emersonii CBS 393.64]
MPTHPDANIRPEATGPAKRLVEQHAAEQPLKLYAGWFCPKKEMFIPEDHVSSIRSILTDRKCNEQLRPRLLPDDPYERARARIWIDYVTSRIIPAFHRFLQYQPPEGASEDAAAEGLAKVRSEFLGHLKEWTRAMDPEGPYFLGKDLSLPDVALAPWAIRLWVFDEFKSGGLGIPVEGSAGEDEPVWQRWRRWLTAIESRRSVQETTSEKQYYLPIYKRYADNVAQSELAKAIRAGRGYTCTYIHTTGIIVLWCLCGGVCVFHALPPYFLISFCMIDTAPERYPPPKMAW